MAKTQLNDVSDQAQSPDESHAVIDNGAVEAPAAPAAPAAPTKPLTKMQQCHLLWDRVYAMDAAELNGKSQRAKFIELAMSEVGMSKPGANTYFQNLSNKAKGQPLYKYNAYVNKPRSAGDEESSDEKIPSTAPTPTKVKAAEVIATNSVIDMTHRWLVVRNGVIVNTYPTREQAKKIAIDSTDLTWHDRNVVADKYSAAQ